MNRPRKKERIQMNWLRKKERKKERINWDRKREMIRPRQIDR